MADTYTHKDLAELTGISETTVKGYRRKFPGFFPVVSRGKPIRYKPQSAEVCKKIREGFEKGLSVNQIHMILKEDFKEMKTVSRHRFQGGQSGVVSPEYLDKFFKTAGQMMQGMAGMATAQAKTEQRLRKIEEAMASLIEIETKNSERFGQLLTQLTTTVSETPPAAPIGEAGVAAAEQKVRARKIVNVKGPEGDVKSYSIEKDENRETPTLERPSDAFLNTPIVIRNDQSEFLGVPGRLPLSGFVEILVREAEEGGASLSNWHREDDAWIFTMQIPGGDSHALHFLSTTTPRGNLVVLLDRLDVNGKQASPQFLQEFFRKVKDKI